MQGACGALQGPHGRSPSAPCCQSGSVPESRGWPRVTSYKLRVLTAGQGEVKTPTSIPSSIPLSTSEFGSPSNTSAWRNEVRSSIRRMRSTAPLPRVAGFDYPSGITLDYRKRTPYGFNLSEVRHSPQRGRATRHGSTPSCPFRVRSGPPAHRPARWLSPASP